MIKEILDHIDGKLTYIEKQYGLAELIDINNDKGPMVYLNSGEYVSVSEFDKYKGVSYWRVTGDIGQDSERDPYRGGNQVLYNRTYPIRLIVVTHRREINTEDNQYTVDRYADKIIGDIGNVSSTIKNSLNLRRCNIFIDSYSWDRNAIIQEEYQKQIALDFKFMLVVFNCSIEVEFTQDCLIDLCD